MILQGIKYVYIYSYSLGLGIVFVHFIDFKFIVYGQFAHFILTGVVHVTEGTTGISVDNTLGSNSQIEYLLELKL